MNQLATRVRDWVVGARPFRRSRGSRSPGPASASDLRVLYAEKAYPQLSESYISAEIAFMRRLGVAVAVWSQSKPKSQADDNLPIFHGTLPEAIASWSPDIVQVHWVHAANSFRHILRRKGVGMTVRGHWHYVPAQIDALASDPSVLAVYLYPHLVARLNKKSAKVLPMVVSYDSKLYGPSDHKDPRLVVRTSAGKRTKELETFLRVAAKCPNHRFVLVVCTLGGNKYSRDLEALNRDLGGAAEILTDLSYSEVARIVGQAGVYLHTYLDDPSVPFGMPVSIAEAMATGAYVICRRLPGAADYVGEAGVLYDSEEMAADLVRATEGWSDERWQLAREASTNRANLFYRDDVVLHAMVDHWLRMLA